MMYVSIVPLPCTGKEESALGRLTLPHRDHTVTFDETRGAG